MAAYAPALLLLLTAPALCVNFTVTLEEGGQANTYGGTDRISITEPTYQVTVFNESIPLLNESFVELNATLAKLEVVSCGVRDILPDAFTFNEVVDEILITGNEIFTIREGVFNDAKVRTLNLSDNKILTVESGAFNNNSFLEIIDLSLNDITFLDPLWFSGSNHLWQFSIDRNKIEVINEAAFQNLARNRSVVIRLSTNIIKEFDPILLKNFQQIEVLDLSNNYLARLEEELFANRTFEHLNLENNKLTCLPDGVFGGGVKQLNLMRNMAFRCECLERLSEWVERRGVAVMYPSIICEYKDKEVMVVYNKNSRAVLPIPKPADFIIPNGVA